MVESIHAFADGITLIETPCRKICALDPVSGLCAGCGRSLREIEQWASLTAAERARVMVELPARLARCRQVTPRNVS